MIRLLFLCVNFNLSFVMKLHFCFCFPPFHSNLKPFKTTHAVSQRHSNIYFCLSYISFVGSLESSNTLGTFFEYSSSKSKMGQADAVEF